MAALFASLLLVACSFTGRTFNTGGLDRIVIGRTTLAQASDYLGALPDDTWQQGDTVLARWGYKGTVATDAVYFRQEAWLRFGPDGTFQRIENRINIPQNFRPQTPEEADQAAAEAVARKHPPTPNQSITDTATAIAQDRVTVSAGSSTDDAQRTTSVRGGDQPTAQAVSTPQPLLPSGTHYTPGVSYPIGRN